MILRIKNPGQDICTVSRLPVVGTGGSQHPAGFAVYQLENHRRAAQICADPIMAGGGVTCFQICDLPAPAVPGQRHRHLPARLFTQRVQHPQDSARHPHFSIIRFQGPQDPFLGRRRVLLRGCGQLQIYFSAQSVHRLPPVHSSCPIIYEFPQHLKFFFCFLLLVL